MVIIRRIWRPSWWILSKALILTAPLWFTYLVFSYEEGKFLPIIPEPWVKPNYELSETSCASWHNLRYDLCEG
jgi:hypothetical protein